MNENCRVILCNREETSHSSNGYFVKLNTTIPSSTFYIIDTLFITGPKTSPPVSTPGREYNMDVRITVKN